MKKMTTKEVVSLVGIAIAAPLFALVLMISARATGLLENDFLLLALALCGAVVSGVNGFGRRTIKAQSQAHRAHEVQPGVAATS
jgi:hypothetical protein